MDILATLFLLQILTGCIAIAMETTDSLTKPSDSAQTSGPHSQFHTESVTGFETTPDHVAPPNIGSESKTSTTVDSGMAEDVIPDTTVGPPMTLGMKSSTTEEAKKTPVTSEDTSTFYPESETQLVSEETEDSVKTQNNIITTTSEQLATDEMLSKTTRMMDHDATDIIQKSGTKPTMQIVSARTPEDATDASSVTPESVTSNKELTSSTAFGSDHSTAVVESGNTSHSSDNSTEWCGMVGDPNQTENTTVESFPEFTERNSTLERYSHQEKLKVFWIVAGTVAGILLIVLIVSFVIWLKTVSGRKAFTPEVIEMTFGCTAMYDDLNILEAGGTPTSPTRSNKVHPQNVDEEVDSGVSMDHFSLTNSTNPVRASIATFKPIKKQSI